MNNTFIAALDCLTERGYPNALELANEIELNQNNLIYKKPPRNIDDLQSFLELRNDIFKVVSEYYKTYTVITGHSFSVKKGDKKYFKVFPLTIDAVAGKIRKREITLVRFIMIKLIMEIAPKVTLKDIGLMFGGRDHSTIIHARDTLMDLMDVDKKLSAEYAEILDKVKSIVK